MVSYDFIEECVFGFIIFFLISFAFVIVVCDDDVDSHKLESFDVDYYVIWECTTDNLTDEIKEICKEGVENG